MIVCVVPDCVRARRSPTPAGTTFARCDAHTCDALAAFAPESWHAAARGHRLPTSIVGGVPITLLDPAGDAAPCAPRGRGFAQRAETHASAGSR